MDIVEIENQISRLRPDELRAFQRWFENYMADQWDRQIEQDAQSGGLDRLVEKLGIDWEKDETSPMAGGWGK